MGQDEVGEKEDRRAEAMYMRNIKAIKQRVEGSNAEYKHTGR